VVGTELAILIIVLLLISSLILAIRAGSIAKGAHVPMPWALVNIGFVVLLLGIPALILRR
jgi:hypothetical protein